MHKAEPYATKKAPGRNLPSGSVAILPLQIDGKKTLAAAAGAAAIAALIAASVARHDGAALRTQRGIRGHGGVERQFLLRAGFGGTQGYALACLAHGIFRTQELGAHPAEDVIHKDRKSTRLNSSHANISYAVFC